VVEILGVVPVLCVLSCDLIAHHDDALALRGHGARRCVAGAATRVVAAARAARGVLGLDHEPVHVSAVDVARRGGGAVGTSVVLVSRVVERGGTSAGQRIGYADPGRDPFGTGKCPEVAIE